MSGLYSFFGLVLLVVSSITGKPEHYLAGVLFICTGGILKAISPETPKG
jgi:hypothetical protein